MADMYCQNKECCYKKNSNQIRGSKGNKHYQSNKANSYMEYWCTNGCRDQWFKDNATTCMTAVGIIGKQTVEVENAWEISAEYNYQTTNGSSHDYFLTNRLMGVRQPITRQQAQTPEQLRNDHGWSRKPDSEAKPLAIELGLAS
jgi:hypothetical protein